MQIRFRNQITLLVAVVFVIGLCLVDAGAQRRKRRSSRRVTHPVASASPSPDATSDNADPRIVSTAEQNAADADQPTAEQRAEALRAQLRDVQAKESDLQGQLEEVDYALKPENIERVVGTFGTTHPEEARDQRRRQLESLQTRIRAQLDQLAQSRVRLEAAITTADAEVDLLRKRMDTLNKPTDAETPAAPVTTTPPPEKPPEKPPEVSPV